VALFVGAWFFVAYWAYFGLFPGEAGYEIVGFGGYSNGVVGEELRGIRLYSAM